MTQDMINKIMTRTMGNLTRGQALCEAKYTIGSVLRLKIEVWRCNLSLRVWRCNLLCT